MTEACPTCGAPNVESSSEPPKQKSFWQSFAKRLGEAVVLTAQQQAAARPMNEDPRLRSYPDGNWAYKDFYSDNSTINVDGSIEFTR